MSDSPKRREQLLADTLHGDWADGPAAAMAGRAAAHARRRRFARRAAAALGGVAIVAAAFISLPRAARSPAAKVAAEFAPAYEIISDEELIALIKDRPLLVLPQETGAKKIVLLDR